MKSIKRLILLTGLITILSAFPKVLLGQGLRVENDLTKSQAKKSLNVKKQKPEHDYVSRAREIGKRIGKSLPQERAKPKTYHEEASDSLYAPKDVNMVLRGKYTPTSEQGLKAKGSLGVKLDKYRGINNLTISGSLEDFSADMNYNPKNQVFTARLKGKVRNTSLETIISKNVIKGTVSTTVPVVGVFTQIYCNLTNHEYSYSMQKKFSKTMVNLKQLFMPGRTKTSANIDYEPGILIDKISLSYVRDQDQHIIKTHKVSLKAYKEFFKGASINAGVDAYPGSSKKVPYISLNINKKW